MVINCSLSTRFKGLFLVLLLACLHACAPKGGAETTVRSAQQLSASATDYVDALTSLIDTTTDLLIQENNTQLLKQYDLLKDMTDQATREQTLSGIIKDQDAAVIKEINALRAYKVQLEFLKTYFTNLQALASGDVGSDTAAAVAHLASNIDAFNNQVRGQDRGTTISVAEGQAVGGLAGLIVTNIRARKLEDALRRDATTIDLYFKNQDKMLDLLEGILKSSSDRLADKKRQEVVQAYVNVKITNPSAWESERREVILAQFSSAAIESARNASSELRTVWRRILSGEDDLGSISAFLTNLNDFVDAANTLKTANESRKASN